MKPYSLEIYEDGTLTQSLDSDLPFQAFAVGDEVSFDMPYLGVIEKIHHFIRDSSRDGKISHKVAIYVRTKK
jgi:hypothetical protein